MTVDKQERNKRETHFAAVHVFDGRFPEREIDVIAVSEGADEIRSCATVALGR
jgi:hypothetical protein